MTLGLFNVLFVDGYAVALFCRGSFDVFLSGSGQTGFVGFRDSILPKDDFVELK